MLTIFKSHHPVLNINFFCQLRFHVTYSITNSQVLGQEENVIRTDETEIRLRSYQILLKSLHVSTY